MLEALGLLALLALAAPTLLRLLDLRPTALPEPPAPAHATDTQMLILTTACDFVLSSGRIFDEAPADIWRVATSIYFPDLLDEQRLDDLVSHEPVPPSDLYDDDEDGEEMDDRHRPRRIGF